ncbi:MAG: alpha/beta hydrolase [Deltaproteobacteria bacterium]|nr:alpha/beta hydrolase [Deltaproteobacteria bacterium]
MIAIFKKSIILIPLVGVIMFIGFYSQIENFFVFHPQTDFHMIPEQMGLPYESINFKAEDGTNLHGWFFPLPGRSPVILFCHGNAGNISHRLGNVQKLLSNGCQVFIYDYRGYGKSTGNPSRKGIYSDGVAAYDYLVKNRNISPDRIFLFGRSLGAAVAMEIAIQRPVKRLILESAFTSTKGLARTMPLFTLISPFLPAHYNNLKKIEMITVPILIIHGNRDEIIPFNMGEELFEVAPEPKAFYAIEGAGHNDTWLIGGRRYFETLERFIQS